MSSKSKTVRDIVAKYIGEEGTPSAAQTVGNTGSSITDPTTVYAFQKNRYTNMLRRKKLK